MAASTDGGKSRLRKRLLIGGVGVLTVAVIFGIAALPRPTALQRADKAIAQGNVRAAQAALLEHLRRFPDATDVRLRLAVLLKKTDAETALVYFRQIPSDSDQYFAAVRHIAQICLLAGRNDEAEQALRVLEQANPDDAAVQLSLAELHFHREEYAQALPYAKRSAELQPERSQTYLLLAEIRDELNQVAEMVSPLKRAIALDANLYPAHVNLAYAYLTLGEFDKAKAQARWCLERDPGDSYPHWVLAATARDEGKMDVARREVRAALELDPDDLNCRLLEADLLMFQREPQRAYERLKPLYDRHRDQARYVGALARAAAASGRSEEAGRLQQRIARFYKKLGNSRRKRPAANDQRGKPQ